MNGNLISGLKPGLRVAITAAASGIGRTIAENFLMHGAKVHICDNSVAAIADFKHSNPEAFATLADVSRIKEVDHYFERVASKLGGLDIMVNNAGISGPTGAIENILPDDWDKTIAVNLNGMFYCLRRAVPMIKKAGAGSIVNISSSAAFFGYPLRSPYAISKWAISGLTKTLAMELGSHQIRVNAICPGSVKGPRIERVIEKDAVARGVSPEFIRDTYLKQVSLRTFIEAQDVANMVLFLCSDLGKNISGQILGIDGHTETLANPD